MSTKPRSRHLLWLTLLVPGTAFAYLDPGTGSIIFQSVLAAALAATFTVKTYWHNLKRLFGGQRTEELESQDSPAGRDKA